MNPAETLVSFLHGKVRVLIGDITAQQVDAIVNAANSTVLGGGGVDGAIHRRGGPEILQQCREIRRLQFPDGLPTGEVVITGGGLLAARHVIHTVGPICRLGVLLSQLSRVSRAAGFVLHRISRDFHRRLRLSARASRDDRLGNNRNDLASNAHHRRSTPGLLRSRRRHRLSAKPQIYHHLMPFV